MKIKKIGHCCLVIDVDGVRIMTDPGNYSSGQENEKNIDLVLITHEHADHIHIDSLLEVIKNNPQCRIITNSAVKVLLDKENISCEVLEQGESTYTVASSAVQIFGKTCPHADIFDGVTPVLNTGYLVANRLFYPGDAWLEIDKPVEVLALPVAGPWSKIRDCIEYAKRVRPTVAFPVHDGMIKSTALGPFRFLPDKFLKEANIDFRSLNDGESFEL